MSDIKRFSPLWGEWEIENKLGEGAYGSVWKVRRNVVGGRVFYAAVKHISIPKEEDATERLLIEEVLQNKVEIARYYDSLLKFLSNEIDLMHRLRGYTNIVDYEDHMVISKENGIGYDIFLRMELLTPLMSKIQQGMSCDDIVHLGKDIATALSVLNDHMMMHGDVKPQNIFINDKGIYKLGDYGTARILNVVEQEGFIQTGYSSYIAPEAYYRQKNDIRSDIYSLGLVLYSLLNGNRLPFVPLAGRIRFEDREQAVIQRLTGVPFISPQYADKKLTSIILKACAYNPEERYKTPEEMMLDLEEYSAKKGENTLGENPIKVFITYSWEDDMHKSWTKQLADELLAKGVEAIIDQYDMNPGDRIPQFMEQSITGAVYVLIICTPKYKEKADNRFGGVGYESQLISGELSAKRNERKYIPILRRGTAEEALPNFLMGKLAIDLSENLEKPMYEKNFSDLIATLRGERKKPQVRTRDNLEKGTL